jgi:hypothetical protein
MLTLQPITHAMEEALVYTVSPKHLILPGTLQYQENQVLITTCGGGGM